MKDQRNGKFSLSLYSERIFLFVTLNPSTPKRDQEIIFSLQYQYYIKQTSDEKRGNSQYGD